MIQLLLSFQIPLRVQMRISSMLSTYHPHTPWQLPPDMPKARHSGDRATIIPSGQWSQYHHLQYRNTLGTTPDQLQLLEVH